MNTKRFSVLATIFGLVLLPVVCAAQINSGSNGSDGAFNPTMNIVINMADHPNGIYQYTSVNISNGVTVTFIPNANNTPVTWLVQSNVIINGSLDVSGKDSSNHGTIYSPGGLGGPGGFRGGNGGPDGSAGQGPGGGDIGNYMGISGSYGGLGYQATNSGLIYGNQYLIPIIGGSGGGGATTQYGGMWGAGGGGGGGAIMIVATSQIAISGSVIANGGAPFGYYSGNFVQGGGGSGGAIRIIGSQIIGTGSISANGGTGPYFNNSGGSGRVRLDTYDNLFSGAISGLHTIGSQFTIIPTGGQLPQLTVTSVGGVAVSASPTGLLSTPDAVLSAQQNNPVPVVVSCANLPLNTKITVSVKPANGAAVTATGYNTTGTLASSTATISIVIPRGGGLIYATAATGN